VFSIKNEMLSFGIFLILSGWNDLEAQDTLNVRVESAEIQGMTDQVKTLCYISLTLRSKSISIELVLLPK
jgi:hypothetical protein